MIRRRIIHCWQDADPEKPSKWHLLLDCGCHAYTISLKPPTFRVYQCGVPEHMQPGYKPILHPDPFDPSVPRHIYNKRVNGLINWFLRILETGPDVHAAGSGIPLRDLALGYINREFGLTLTVREKWKGLDELRDEGHRADSHRHG